MLMQFPVPYRDELLSSILARFIQRQGINADKQALELLFGSRNIVPSSLFQGHIQKLLANVGHIWKATPEQIIEKYTLLNVYKPFMGNSRYVAQKNELISSDKNHSLISIGVNASKLTWPLSFQYCPVCVKQDLTALGETYWRRYFQLPGMSCCPMHLCQLVDSDITFHASQRHAFVPADNRHYETSSKFGIVASDSHQTILSEQIYQLFNKGYSNHSTYQWSHYYQNLARSLNLMTGKQVDHEQISALVRGAWGDCWLHRNGLSLEIDNNWLLAIFRKHRRPFTYLHHLVVMIALLGDSISIEAECSKVSSLPNEPSRRNHYSNSEYDERKGEYRSIWLKLVNQFKTLKEIRATKEGARVYSWLYRFDRKWQKMHMLTRLSQERVDNRVDWVKRDRELVRLLLNVEKIAYSELTLPRKSRAWFVKQVAATNVIPDNLNKLPLCECFLSRYPESVEEYQLRRLLAIVVNKLNNGQAIPKRYELERSAGLSKERIRKPAAEVLRVDIPRIARKARLTRGYKINSNSRYSASS
ncbi:TnsD family Tn7-like transposition protein [Pseudoalteromonas sp.]|uniref:TnsD family Tn7-like transposition protein n=1 Tax=Pseudoalteromonas sp. TaxID=53249 RepID=UPI002607F967|nr:TnsD family Tn7-like transposition protein [Pseudoalteromonas sp.]MCP3865791.1 transcriptional antiterminator [Aestuariibacter sp.]MCP4061389.1 transcriptional antiterminator [Pseudoalteromonas sp.]MCP4587404.1 transcriptional antiterminator [Pseudoalteromonas sp.]